MIILPDSISDRIGAKLEIHRHLSCSDGYGKRIIKKNQYKAMNLVLKYFGDLYEFKITEGIPFIDGVSAIYVLRYTIDSKRMDTWKLPFCDVLLYAEKFFIKNKSF